MATNPNPQWDPFTFRNFLMEIVFLHLDDVRVGFQTSVFPSNLTNLAMLDSTEPESSSYLPSGPIELSSTLQRAVKNAAHEAEIKAAMSILFNPDNAQLLVCVENLINSELKEKGILQQDGIKQNLRTKALTLGQHRILDNLKHGTQPADYIQNPKRYEFCVHLITLVGGQAAYTRNTKLYFAYTTPFYQFEKTLQTETQLCIIPPLAINHSISAQRDQAPSSELATSVDARLHESANSTDTSQTPSTQTPFTTSESYRPKAGEENSLAEASTVGAEEIEGQANDKASISSGEPIKEINQVENISKQESGGVVPGYISSAYGTNWVIPPRPRSRSVKGFTLDDGHWCYCMIDIDGKKGEVLELNDEKTYLSILDTLMTKNRSAEKILEKRNMELEGELKATTALLADALKSENKKLEEKLKLELKKMHDELQKNNALLQDPKLYESKLMIQHSLERIARGKWTAEMKAAELRSRVTFAGFLDDADERFDYFVQDTTRSYSQTMI